MWDKGVFYDDPAYLSCSISGQKIALNHLESLPEGNRFPMQ